MKHPDLQIFVMDFLYSGQLHIFLVLVFIKSSLTFYRFAANIIKYTAVIFKILEEHSKIVPVFLIVLITITVTLNRFMEIL